MKKFLKKLKTYVGKNHVNIACVVLGVLVIGGAFLVHNVNAQASYQLTLVRQTAMDTWTVPCANSSTCTFTCDASTVGQTCQTKTCSPGYTAPDGSSGNMAVNNYQCKEICAANSGQTCSSPANACGTVTYGTYDCNGNCSVTSAPALPAGYGNSCSSSANACGTTNSGTIQCNGSCSASTPANPANYGNACTSAANSCGQTSSGTIGCTGSCSASTPANPAGYGSSCTSAANSCGMTNSGTIGCSGACSASTPSNSLCPPTCVSNKGASCTSSANACGATNTGTVQCDGSCSAGTPSLPSGYGNSCTSSANSCGMTNSGTIGCSGSCSASTPSNSLCGPSCTPDSSCTANTCQGSTCTDSCGNTYSGTKICSAGSCNDTGPVSLTASPSLIRSNTQTNVTFTWNVSNASGKCTLTGPNLSTSTAAPTSCSINGNYQTSVNLSGNTTYTLTCPGGEIANAVIRVVPYVQQF